MEVSDAQIGIFWDYENCPAPSNMSGYDVVSSIRELGHAFGSIKHLKAYTEFVEQTPRSMCLRSELQSSGVSIIDCPHNGRKNVADQMIIADMLTFAMDNPSASSTAIMLISGDRDFAYVLSILRLRMYRVVVVAPSLPGAHISLKSQASHFLEWHRVILSPSKEETSSSLLGYRRNEVSTRANPSHCKSRSSVARTSDFVNMDALHTDSPAPSRVHLEANSSQGPELVEVTNVKVSPGPTMGQQPPSQSPPLQPLSATDADDYSPPVLSYPDTELKKSPPMYSAAMPASPRPAVTAGGLPRPVDAEVSQQSNQVSTLRGGHSSSPPTPKASSLSSSFSSGYPSRAQSAVPSIPVPAPPSPPPALVFGSTPPISTAASTTPPAPVCPTPSPPRPPTLSLSIPISASPSLSAAAAPIATLGPVSTSPSSRPPIAPVALPIPVAQPPPPLAPHSKPVPAPYQSLVQILESFRSKGIQRPSRSIIATTLVKQDKLAFKNAGVQRFKEYSTSAETLGLIQLGGKEGDAWISLHPDLQKI